MSNRALTLLVGIVATILLGWVLHAAAGILQPLVIALFLCSMLQPVVRWLAHRHIPPAVTVIALVVLLFGAFVRTGIWVQSQIKEFVGLPAVTAPAEAGVVPASEGGQAQAASEPPPDSTSSAQALQPDASEEGSVPDELLATGNEGQRALDRPEGEGPSDGEQPVRPIGWSGIVDNLAAKLRDSNLPDTVISYAIATMQSIDARQKASDLLGTTLGFTTGLLLVVIYMLFIFAEQAIFRRKILSVTERPEDAAATLDTIARGIQRYLSVKTVVSLATGVLCYSVLEGLRVPYAPFFGFLTFLLNFIPTFGSLAAGTLATITTFAAKGSWESALVVAITYLAVNMALGSYIEPRILGRELNLSPLVVLISVVVWAGLWGVAGTFLAVPLTATIQIVLANNEATRPIAVLLSSGPPREDRKRKTQRPRRLPKTANT